MQGKSSTAFSSYCLQDAAEGLIKLMDDAAGHVDLCMHAVMLALEANCELKAVTKAIYVLLDRIAWNAAAAVASVELLLSCEKPLVSPGNYRPAAPLTAAPNMLYGTQSTSSEQLEPCDAHCYTISHVKSMSI